jgi:sRNA-binding regulator protein Hfq
MFDQEGLVQDEIDYQLAWDRYEEVRIKLLNGETVQANGETFSMKKMFAEKAEQLISEFKHAIEQPGSSDFKHFASESVEELANEIVRLEGYAW